MFIIVVAVGIFILISYCHYKRSDYYEKTKKSFTEVTFNKGTKGEYKTFQGLEKVRGYHQLLYNCYIPKLRGGYTEVDLVMVHTTGIYVFESKNIGGWIFGNEHYQQWTQVLPAKHYKSQKNKFYNPLFQNQGHIRNLSRFLNLDEEYLHSFIVFSNRCVFKKLEVKSKQHMIVKQGQLDAAVNHEIRKQKECFSTNGVDQIVEKLKTSMDVNEQIKKEHIKEVKARAKGKAVIVGRELRCPYCNSKLVVRRVKQGPHAGRKFYGCSNYPRCRFTKNIS